MNTDSDSKTEPSAMLFGNLPAWGQDDLPAPPPFTLRNLFRTIGPGAILLAGSIGGGEWLVGPAISVRYGTGILWIALVAVALQLIVNLEAIRYTLYCGEPIITGVMRLPPGKSFWSKYFVLVTVAQLGVPALAAGCASVLFASIMDRTAEPGDTSMVLYLTYGVILCTVVLLLSGKSIERMLEYISWFMVTAIFSFLLIVNILFVPASHWVETLSGFLQFGSMPADVDLMLLGAFAATAGAGGVGNLVISNWYRDKGFGMGAKVGAISGVFGDGHARQSPVGIAFPVTAPNMARWRIWWKYVSVDQVFLWGGGCLVGMFLNVNLATAVIPSGSDLDHMAAGTFQARYMAQELWSGFWFLALLNGFWVLFSTHLGNTDILVRIVTDTLSASNSKQQSGKGINVSKLYYVLLAIFTVWGLFAVHWGHAMTLFKILGVVAGPVLAIAAIQILIVNTKLLPVELRPPIWRRVALVTCSLFYGSLSAALLWSLR